MSTKNSFEALINDENPVLIDFTAAWCGPCKMMAPVLQQLAGKLGDRARIIKIDIDKNQALATKLRIMSVPTFMLYKKGKLLWKKSGAIPGPELESVIMEAIE